MKRFILGTLAAAYLALIGAQAAHHHKDALQSTTDNCSVCALAHQSVSQAPNAAPALVQNTDSRSVVPAESAANSRVFVARASARAPPAAV